MNYRNGGNTVKRNEIKSIKDKVYKAEKLVEEIEEVEERLQNLDRISSIKLEFGERTDDLVLYSVGDNDLVVAVANTLKNALRGQLKALKDKLESL